jgi:hypothetical protein
VQDIVVELRRQLEPLNQLSLTGQEIGMALFGLQHIQLDEHWLPIVRSFCDGISLAVAQSRRYLKHEQYGDDIRSLSRYLSIVLNLDSELCRFLQHHGLYDSLVCIHQEVVESLQVLLSKIGAHLGPQSATERRYIQILEQTLDKYNLSISDRNRDSGSSSGSNNSAKAIEMYTNRYLHGFEADIVLYVFEGASDHTDCDLDTEASDPEASVKRMTVIDIEIDGVHHKVEHGKKNFCAYRDRYLLESHGVCVVRLDTMQTWTDEEISQWFVEQLQAIGA